MRATSRCILPILAGSLAVWLADGCTLTYYEPTPTQPGATAPPPGAGTAPAAGYGGTVSAAPAPSGQHALEHTDFMIHASWNASLSGTSPDQPSLCRLPDGGVLAVWQEGAGKLPMIMSAVLAKNEAQPSAPAKLLEPGYAVEGLVCEGTKKGAVVIWKQPGGDIVFYKMDLGGLLVGKPVKVTDVKSQPQDFDTASTDAGVWIAWADGETIGLARIDHKGKVVHIKALQAGGAAKQVKVVEERPGGLVYVFWADELAGHQSENVHYVGLGDKGKVEAGPHMISPGQGEIVELDVTPDPEIHDVEHRFLASIEFSKPDASTASWKYFFHDGQLSSSPVDNGATTTLMHYVEADGDLTGECFAVPSSGSSGAGFRCWADNWSGDFHLDTFIVTGTSYYDVAFDALLHEGTFFVAYVAEEGDQEDVFIMRAFDRDLVDPPPPPPPTTYATSTYPGSSYSSGYGSSWEDPPDDGTPEPGLMSSPDEVTGSCTWNGIPLHGKVQVVDAFPDIKVGVVSAFPDLKVKKVDAFPDDCGEWEFVDAFPDFTIEYVDAFPDITIEFVDAFPGL